MKVFIAGTSFDPAYGGPAYSVSRMAVALAEQGVTVGLWAPDQSAGRSPLLAGEGRVRKLSGTLPQAFAAFGDPQVVHDNGIWLRHNHRLATFFAQRGVPRVVSTRGMLEPWAMTHKSIRKRIAWRAYQRRDLTNASAHHATSEVEAGNIARLGLGVPVSVIPNGVDIPDVVYAEVGTSQVATSDMRRVALFLGRIYPVKGLPMLVEAWSRVRPEGWRLVIAGPDEAGHQAHVQAAIDAAGLAEVIAFAGLLDGAGKQAAFRQAELFILPTHSESFGMSVAEALAHAVPVVTTTAAPWSSIVDAECGWWVAPTADGLSGALRDATSRSEGVLASMGQRGRKLAVSRYDWATAAAQFVVMYQSVL